MRRKRSFLHQGQTGKPLAKLYRSEDSVLDGSELYFFACLAAADRSFWMTIFNVLHVDRCGGLLPATSQNLFLVAAVKKLKLVQINQAFIDGRLKKVKFFLCQRQFLAHQDNCTEIKQVKTREISAGVRSTGTPHCTGQSSARN